MPQATSQQHNPTRERSGSVSVLTGEERPQFFTSDIEGCLWQLVLVRKGAEGDSGLEAMVGAMIHGFPQVKAASQEPACRDYKVCKASTSAMSPLAKQVMFAMQVGSQTAKKQDWEWLLDYRFFSTVTFLPPFFLFFPFFLPNMLHKTIKQKETNKNCLLPPSISKIRQGKKAYTRIMVFEQLFCRFFFLKIHF